MRNKFVYPLLQGLDSVNIDADIEIGGLDQTFNILTGREMQGKAGKEKQVAMFMPIIEGLDGVEKMGKSLGNHIGITEGPDVMFQKVMTVKDHLMIKYFNLLTDLTPAEINGFIKAMTEEGANPRDIKRRLAWGIVKLYHSEKAADKASKAFEHIFTQGQVPEDILAFPWRKDDNRLYHCRIPGRCLGLLHVALEEVRRCAVLLRAVAVVGEVVERLRVLGVLRHDARVLNRHQVAPKRRHSRYSSRPRRGQ